MPSSLYYLGSCEVHRYYLRNVTGPFRPPGEQNWIQATLPSVTKVTQPSKPLVDVAFPLDEEWTWNFKP